MTLLRNAAAAALTLGLLAQAAPAAAATVIAESRFNAGAEGWRNGDFTGGNAFHAVSWDARGFISADDSHGQFSAFLAPGAYLGDQLAAIGGTLSFDLASDFRDTNGAALPYVTLQGNGVLLFGLISTTPPTAPFSRYQVELSAANFLRGNPEDGVGTRPVTDAEFRAVLRNLKQLSIRADIASGPDLARLDNVALTAGAGVPEPAAWAMMITGFGLAGATLRRRAALVRT